MMDKFQEKICAMDELSAENWMKREAAIKETCIIDIVNFRTFSISFRRRKKLVSSYVHTM